MLGWIQAAMQQNTISELHFSEVTTYRIHTLVPLSMLVFGKTIYLFLYLLLRNFTTHIYHNLDDQLTNIQNDLNGNKQKIEDANGVIKRHTEQLIELEPEINDLKHEMSELDRHVKGKYSKVSIKRPVLLNGLVWIFSKSLF